MAINYILIKIGVRKLRFHVLNHSFLIIEQKKQGNLEKRSISELALAYSLITTKLLFYATYICDIIAYINFSIVG